MKKRYLFILMFLVLAGFAAYYYYENIYAASYIESSDVETAELESVDTEPEFVILAEGLERPVCGAVNHSADHELRVFENYSLCYRESYEQAEWSAYCLSYLQQEKNAARSNDFRPDPQISTGSADLSDYRKSGYDRGHLTPAADMSFSEQAMSETFFMSNMTPQSPQFNRGIWKDLEAQVRIWVTAFGRVYVVSGPVLDKAASEYKTIGENEVAVPDYFYKVILVPLYEDESDRQSLDDAKSVMAIGFVIPNQKCEDDFWNYAVPVDEVENLTGLDFFALLEDGVENKIEEDSDTGRWH